MIIVNQDKEMIVNFDNVEYIWISKLEKNEDDTFKIVTQAAFGNMIIGRYKTEGRAKEVLQEIISKYKQWGKDANNAVTISPKVYEMPKE